MAWDDARRRRTRCFEVFLVVVVVSWVLALQSVPLPSALAATVWSDVNALRDLGRAWNATPGLPQNWTWGSDPCWDHWIGVACLQESVISLRLPGEYGIRGTLSPSIGQLKNLLSLNLQNNPGLTGSIPNEIGNLKQLYSLDLSNCSFSGKIPLGLGNLRNASYLYLNRNNLSGEIPYTIGYLSKAVSVSLGWNHLAGPIPVSSPTRFPIPVGINNLTSLLILDLEYNHLSGDVPSSLGQLQRLTTLHLQGNQLSGCLLCAVSNGPNYGLNNATSLVLIDLSLNAFMGPPPQFLLELPVVSILNLSLNQFSGDFDSSVRTTGYVNVDLIDNNITNVVNSPSPFVNPILGGNPVCANQSFPFPDLCDYSSDFLGPTQWQQPLGCSTPRCPDERSVVHPATCVCSYPYIAHLLLAWTPTFGLDGARMGNVRTRVAAALQVAPEMVWVEEATYPNGTRNQLSATMLFYPPPTARLWVQSQVSTLEAQLVNRSVKLGIYDPYALVSSNLETVPVNDNEGIGAPTAGAKSNHQSMPIIAGVIGGFVVLVILISVSIFFIKRRRTPDNLDNAAEIFDLNLSDLPNFLFSYNELQSSTRNFHRGNKIGEGTFGPVFKGTMRDGSEVAVKELPSNVKTCNQDFINEVEIIAALQHKNLVKLRGCGIRNNSRLLVYEYMENNCLAQSLFGQKAVVLEWRLRYNLVLGMAKGLAYLHSRGPTRLAHGDLKASNILLDSNMEPKIADFGLARMCQNNERKVLTRIEGKRGYVAPEYARYGQLTPKTDVFSFGIIALEIVSGRESMNQKLPAEEQYLLSWAWTLYDESRLMDLIDPKVRDCCNPAEARLLIKVALLCSQGEAASRPHMVRVVAILAGEADVADSPQRPAFLGLGGGSTTTAPTRAVSAEPHVGTVLTTW